MEKNRLRQVMIDQQDYFTRREGLIDRDINLDYFMKGDEIIVISGIRRCGKSSLLKLIADRVPGGKVFLDFDDIRLSDFEIQNYQDIEDISSEICGRPVTYFFDEIQNAPQWERWVNNLHSRRIKVFVTGSNSNLLSSEISTFLTGRNKQIKLHPFSFKEFLRLGGLDPEAKGITTAKKTEIYKRFVEYLEKGGFPLIIINDDVELSRQYFEDIFNKDIVNRYGVREVKELKDLVLFLFSNVGKIYSYSTLMKISCIKSLSTVKNYIDYFRNVFLAYRLDLFDYSIKKQKVSSSKIYVGDNSFLKTVAFNFTKNLGRRLENLVFLQLVRDGAEIYYHSDRHECDFITKRGQRIDRAIQVTTGLGEPHAREREINGLLEAMRKYKLKEGLILTLEEKKTIRKPPYKIIVKPVWEWLL